MSPGRKRKDNRVAFFALVFLLLLAARYTDTSGGAGDILAKLWETVSRREPAVEPPAGGDANPGEPLQADPEPVTLAPEPSPEPEPSLPADPGGDKPEDPVIYAGQKLMIPVKGEAKNAASKVIKQGNTTGNGKQIALTFDAGWLHEQTILLLDVLDQYGVKSTFFPRALWVTSYPELAREIVERGHILENHSLTHGHMREMTDQQISEELRESTRILKEVRGSNPTLFRPPYGEYDTRMLKILGEEGYPYTVMWTVDTFDWAEEIRGEKVTADYLVNRVLSNASDRGIVLMHIGGYKTVEALPRMITGLREKGYELVTVNEMLLPREQTVVTHTALKGETLYSISRQYGVSVEQLILANGL